MSRPPVDTPALPGALEPDWHADGTPFSPEFGDVYYSRDGGAEESAHVFLAASALPARWATLGAGSLFTVAETGFGTGLNFLLCWHRWRAHAPRGARLLFRSLEARPLSRTAMHRALGNWPGLAEQAAALLEAWPPALDGLHTLVFDEGRVTLQLYVGDVEDALEEFVAGSEGAAVDAWFLDGFAPARNPRMWEDAVLERVGALTRPGGSVATFSSAAAVRRGLQQAGFAVHKAPGFGRKREMLCGTRTDAAATAPAPRRGATPWHRAAAPATHVRDALVIGAGIAGSATAHALATRGWRVGVLEAAAAPAEGASGNPQGILFTQLPAADSAHGEFTLASYLFALRWYATLLGAQPESRSACGLLQLYDGSEAQRFAALSARYAALPELARALDRELASAHAGLPLASGGMLLPGSGWVDPRAACRAALATPGIELHCGERVLELRHADGSWEARSAGGGAWRAPVVVLANARAAATLLPEPVVPLEGVRGQITLLPAGALPAAPRCVLCAEGYLVPARGALACCGASFRRGQAADSPTLEEQRENLARVAAITPAFDPAALDPSTLGARVAERCATPDRLPIAGAVPDAQAFLRTYAPLGDNARRTLVARAPCQPGLLLNVGHGSRGLCSAPLAAELIAAQLCGEPLPVTQRVARAVSPARFLLRRIVRGEAA